MGSAYGPAAVRFLRRLAPGDAEVPIDTQRSFMGVGLGFAMAISAGAILYLNRGTTFSYDEVAWVVGSPDLGLDDAAEPHAGHLVLTSRLIYKFVLETLGPGYLPFRLLSAGAVLLTAGLFFTYASRRIGRLAALAPTLVLLFFGSDPLHILQGNAFTVLLSVSCGLAALLLLERDSRRRDISACILLCLGVVTYTVALAFAVGAAVLILMRADRWRRIWIVAVPIALYGAWWLWARGSPETSQDQLVLSNLLLFPVWSFQSLTADLTALTGLNYDFAESTSAAGAGVSALAVVGLVALAWRLDRGSIAPPFWAALAVPLTYWLMLDLVALRFPDDTRYLYPGAVAVLLVACEALRGTAWTRNRLVALYLMAGVSLATNLTYLRFNASELRNERAPQTRAAFAALELADGNADPAYDPSAGPFSAGPFNIRGDQPTAAYLTAADRYGGIGYSPDQLRVASAVTRAEADTYLAGALDLKLRPARSAGTRCHGLEPGPDGGINFVVPLDGAVLTVTGGTASLVIRRFGDAGSTVSLGKLMPGASAILQIPSDDAPDPWLAAASGARELTVCRPAVSA